MRPFERVLLPMDVLAALLVDCEWRCHDERRWGIDCARVHQEPVLYRG